MEVKLYKKLAPYVDRESGEERNAMRFYLQAGDSMIPIQVTYFGTQDKPDRAYSGRKTVLSAFADPLPDKAADDK